MVRMLKNFKATFRARRSRARARDDFDLMTISSIQTFYTMMDGFEKSRGFTYCTFTVM